jgi:hypothetical protein
MSSTIQTVKLSTAVTPHVCKSGTCAHDNLTPPGADQKQTSAVMPLWMAPLVKQHA